MYRLACIQIRVHPIFQTEIITAYNLPARIYAQKVIALFIAEIAKGVFNSFYALDDTENWLNINLRQRLIRKHNIKKCSDKPCILVGEYAPFWYATVRPHIITWIKLQKANVTVL